MRKLRLTLTILFSYSITFAQSPDLFSYQGIARDNQGVALQNQAISLKIIIWEQFPTPSGINVYEETHSVTTNQFGLFTVQIGAGTVVSGNISTINWNPGHSFFIETAMDATGGTNYTQMGISQLLSVPFAKLATEVMNDKVNDADFDPNNELQSLSYSNDTLTISNGNFVIIPTTIDTDDQNLSLSNDTLYIQDGNNVYLGSYINTDNQTLSLSNDTLYISNGNNVFLPDNVFDGDSSTTNELQTLTYSNDTLYLSNGNSVYIQGNVYDGDSSSTNELQALSLSNDTIYLSNGGFVKLPPAVDNDWTISGSNIYNGNTGNVGIGNTSPVSKLHVTGLTSIDGSRLEFINIGGSVFIGFGAGANDDLTNNNNVFVGTQSGNSNTSGSENTTLGHSALRQNTSGANNTSIGNRSMRFNTSGLNNSAFGLEALYSNTTGSTNTAIGRRAMYSNTTAGSNSALGNQALYSNTNGSSNTAVGNDALYTNSTGGNNTAVGFNSLYLNSGGFFNTAIGNQSLYSNSFGNNNAAIGRNALYNNTSGSNNSAIGYNAFFNGASFSNSTALGYATDITASNQVRVGNASVTSIGGFANWTNVSDARFKVNIKENVPGLDFITKLRAVTYNLDLDAIAKFHNTPDEIRVDETEKSQQIQTGFIAQEVEEAAKKLGFEFSGVDAPKNETDHYGLRYSEFVVPIVKAIQEQQLIIEELRKQNELLLKRIEILENK
jgi:hypothetical protein